jgi:hypothetical protein
VTEEVYPIVPSIRRDPPRSPIHSAFLSTLSLLFLLLELVLMTALCPDGRQAFRLARRNYRVLFDLCAVAPRSLSVSQVIRDLRLRLTKDGAEHIRDIPKQ